MIEYVAPVCTVISLIGNVIVFLLVMPLRKKSEQLETLSQEIHLLRTKQVVENVEAHKVTIEKLNTDISALKDKRFMDLQEVSEKINAAVLTSIKEGAESRKFVHLRLDSLEKGQATLDERTDTTNKALADLTREVREIGKDVTAALTESRRRP